MKLPLVEAKNQEMTPNALRTAKIPKRYLSLFVFLLILSSSTTKLKLTSHGNNTLTTAKASSPSHCSETPNLPLNFVAYFFEISKLICLDLNPKLSDRSGDSLESASRWWTALSFHLSNSRCQSFKLSFPSGALELCALFGFWWWLFYWLLGRQFRSPSFLLLWYLPGRWSTYRRLGPLVRCLEWTCAPVSGYGLASAVPMVELYILLKISQDLTLFSHLVFFIHWLGLQSYKLFSTFCCAFWCSRQLVLRYSSLSLLTFNK